MDLKAQLRAKIAANQGRHARARDVNTLNVESRELPSARLIASTTACGFCADAAVSR